MSDQLHFPLKFEFRFFSISPQFLVYDAYHNEIAFVKQKLFRLKEAITVYNNSSQTEELFKINAKQWIDWSANYEFNDAIGNYLGKVARHGTRSMWKATYDIYDSNDVHEFRIEEDNGFVKVMDSLFSEIPLIGILSGYVFNPKYNVVDSNGEKVAVFIKNKSLMGLDFSLELLQNLPKSNQIRIALSLMMMVLLERKRG